MPTYEYACRSCGQHLEVVQSFKDDALTECPSCQGALRKVFSAAGIIFKGSGWHVKDYASTGGATATGSSSSDSGDSSSAPASGEKKAGSEGAKKDSGTGSTAKAASSGTSSKSGGSSSGSVDAKSA